MDKFVTLFIDPLSFVFVVLVPYIIISFTYSPTEQVRKTGMIIACTAADFLKVVTGLLAHMKHQNISRKSQKESFRE